MKLDLDKLRAANPTHASLAGFEAAFSNVELTEELCFTNPDLDWEWAADVLLSPTNFARFLAGCDAITSQYAAEEAKLLQIKADAEAVLKSRPDAFITILALTLAEVKLAKIAKSRTLMKACGFFTYYTDPQEPAAQPTQGVTAWPETPAPPGSPAGAPLIH